MTPKSQAKKPPISTIPIFSYFLTPKKYHVNKYTIQVLIVLWEYLVMHIIMLYTLNYQSFCML